MKKKLFALLLCVAVVASLSFGLVACNNGGTTTVDDGNGVTIGTVVNVTPDYSYVGDLTGKSLTVGAILVGDETEGYTEAHMEGMATAKATIEAAGGSVTIINKKMVPEDATCATACSQTIASGATLVVTNSYGHQFQIGDVVTANPSVTFVAMTGDLAAGTGKANYKNAFTDVYQARYASGVVAGLKLKQLVDDNKLAAKNFNGENIRIGYVGAFPYAEVVSGYTAFYLGIKSVVSNIEMHVQYTNSWFNFDSEYETAKSLIAEGCIIIGQHADSEGAPTACEEAYTTGTRVYSVGYNVDMLEAAPHAALTSSTNTWAVYYTYLFSSMMKGTAVETNWAKGFSDGAVAITAINGKVFSADPSATVKNVIDGMKAGTVKVFDCSKFTVKGANLTTYTGAYGMDGAECIKGNATDGYYFEESVLRSAPYFDIRIDGITETGAAQD